MHTEVKIMIDVVSSIIINFLNEQKWTWFVIKYEMGIIQKSLNSEWYFYTVSLRLVLNNGCWCGFKFVNTI